MPLSSAGQAHRAAPPGLLCALPRTSVPGSAEKCLLDLKAPQRAPYLVHAGDRASQPKGKSLRLGSRPAGHPLRTTSPHSRRTASTASCPAPPTPRSSRTEPTQPYPAERSATSCDRYALRNRWRRPRSGASAPRVVQDFARSGSGPTRSSTAGRWRRWAPPEPGSSARSTLNPVVS